MSKQSCKGKLRYHERDYLLHTSGELKDSYLSQKENKKQRERINRWSKIRRELKRKEYSMLANL
jgi:hypothetical protein